MQKPRRQRRRGAHQKPSAPATRGRRTAAWLVPLTLILALAGSYGWLHQRNAVRSADSLVIETTPVDDDTPVDDNDAQAPTPVPDRSSATAQPLSPTPPTADATADVDIVAAPGSTQTSFVAPLADAYRRLDPTADGWETEAFHEATSRQSEKLAHLFTDLLTEDGLLSLADDRFGCSDLTPEPLREVFRDESLRVQRAESLPAKEPDAATGEPQLRGAAGLRAAIEHFRQLYLDGRIERVKLKPFRVAIDDNQTATTTAYFQSYGKASSGTLQINAKWNLRWSSAVDSAPKLLSIQLEEYEAVEYRTTEANEPLFSDCTVSVLGETDAYANQFLRSSDYWRARLPRDLGIDVVANHGLALGDVNGDHLDDIYVCQQGGLPNRLFIQNADGTLREATAESGADWLDYCASALLVDFDNDGDRDLVVAQEWRILLMSNNGQGQFQLEFGTSTEAQAYSLATADYDLDGDLDIYVCGYNPTASTLRRGAMGEPMPYHDANNGGRNMLLRNDGNWDFTDATAETGLDHNNTRFSFAAAWEDFDNDGDPDLYVANDYGRNSLYQNNQGHFVDVAADLGVEDMSSGMSACWGDFNRDGWMDLYVSNMFSAAGNRITYQRQFKSDADASVREHFQRMARGNTLFLNTGTGFRDVSEQAGVTMGRWSWGSRFADVNGDGWSDLIVANGFISTEDTGDL
ncbi:MAG: VCBS repeat-containing protein [Planctomycetales bacterium]|nr:VCBS repeat-containing protein [Planctomycetales bacterium]